MAATTFTHSCFAGLCQQQRSCRTQHLGHAVPEQQRVRRAWPLHCTATSPSGTSTAQNRFELLNVTIRKPLGLVLAEAPAGSARSVVVESIAEGSNAAKSGVVRVGDYINRCSATVLKAGKGGEYEKEGYGQRPYTNWETVLFDCKDQDFKTVLAAIGSNNERWGINKVTLELRRPVMDA